MLSNSMYSQWCTTFLLIPTTRIIRFHCCRHLWPLHVYWFTPWRAVTLVQSTHDHSCAVYSWTYPDLVLPWHMVMICMLTKIYQNKANLLRPVPMVPESIWVNSLLFARGEFTVFSIQWIHFFHSEWIHLFLFRVNSLKWNGGSNSRCPFSGVTRWPILWAAI